jgi:hypothetical protein
MLLAGAVDIPLLQDTIVRPTDVRVQFAWYSDYYSFVYRVASERGLSFGPVVATCSGRRQAPHLLLDLCLCRRKRSRRLRGHYLYLGLSPYRIARGAVPLMPTQGASAALR